MNMKSYFNLQNIYKIWIEISSKTMMHCLYLIIWSRWLKFNLIFYLRIKHNVSNFCLMSWTRAHFLHRLLIILFCLMLTIWQHPHFCSIVSNNTLKNYLLLLCWGATMLNFLRLKSEHWDPQVEAVY